MDDLLERAGLERTIAQLRLDLHDAHEAARALAAGEVDAVVGTDSTPVLLLAAQARLREQEKILRAVFESALTAILLANEDGAFVEANPAACDLFGLPSERLLGRSIVDFVAPDPAAPPTDWKGVFGTKYARGEFLLLRADGTQRTLEFSSVPSIVPGLNLSTFRDVTERKNQETALREARYFLEQTETVAEVGCWVAPATEKGPIFWTREMYRIAGLPAGAPLTRGAILDTVVHPEDRAAVAGALQRAVEGGPAFELDCRLVRGDGEVRWVHARAILDAAENGQRRSIGTVQDITERRKGDERLRASDERYRRIIETTSEGVWLSDAEFRTTFVNQPMADMLGYTREEMIGQEVFGFMTDEGRVTSESKFEGRLERKSGDTYENAYRRKDGTTCWALARTNPIFEGGIFVGTVGLVSNLTEQRKADETRVRLAAIVESSGDAIISKTLDGTISSWNNAAAILFGYTAEEIIGQPGSILIPQDQQGEEPAVLTRLANGAPVEHRETFRRRKDGSLVEVALHVALLRGAQGQVIGTSKIVRDITERRKHEAALRRSEDKLRQSQKLESIGSLAGGIAHDFNNLLSVILGYTSLLIGDMGDRDPMKGDLDEVHKAGLRAAELTRQLLAFSRQQILEPRVLDLNRIIDGVQKMLVRMLGEDMVFNLRKSDALGRVHADPSQVEQVLMNLVINARDAMPRGGTVSIETSNVVLGAAEAEDQNAGPGPYVLLAVTDTGTGMDAATMARVFDPFFSTKDTGKGTGLGLSTVHGIVEQSGGHIRLRSELGKGSRFEVYLPTTDRELQEPVSLAPAGSSCRGTETILLVEDEDAVRNVMRSILRKQGYEVLDAQNAGEAFLISEQRTKRIDLLLTDVVMPRMSGGELAEILLSRHPEMAVLFVSGYAKDAIVQHGVRDEGRAFLAKPMTPQGLARKVREVLDVAKAEWRDAPLRP